MAVETFVLVSSNCGTEFPGHAVRRKKRHCPSGATLADIRRPSSAPDRRRERLVKSVRGRQKQYPPQPQAKPTTAGRQDYCFPLHFYILYFMDIPRFQPKLPKNHYESNPLRIVCHIGSLLFASCGRQPSDIVESSPNGVTGVKMPILVTFKGGRRWPKTDLEEAVSISPPSISTSTFQECGCCGSSPVAPEIRHPLQGDHRRRETHRTARLKRRRVQFATPKLRFSYSDYWLQQSDDLKPPTYWSARWSRRITRTTATWRTSR